MRLKDSDGGILNRIVRVKSSYPLLITSSVDVHKEHGLFRLFRRRFTSKILIEKCRVQKLIRTIGRERTKERERGRSSWECETITLICWSRWKVTWSILKCCEMRKGIKFYPFIIATKFGEFLKSSCERGFKNSSQSLKSYPNNFYLRKSLVYCTC